MNSDVTESRGQLDGDRVAMMWAGASHVGKVRKLNEDAFLLSDGLYAVADGMGGHEAGEVASAIAIDVCREFAVTVPLHLDDVVSLVAEANSRVYRHAIDAGTLGMGTTLVGAAMVDNAGDVSLVVFNVGDSRCYSYSAEAGLVRLTSDHSVVQELLDLRRITEEEAHVHPERNVVTRAIGIEASVAGDFFVLPSTGSSRLLVCSDGVSGQVSELELEKILADEVEPEDAVAQVLELVLAGPAPDNATAIVIDVFWHAHDRTSSATPDDITGPRPGDDDVTQLIDAVPVAVIDATLETPAPPITISEVPE